MNRNLYIMDFNTSTNPAFRLFCFPYAGSGASFFAQWQNNFHRTIEIKGVQLPGRENRISESPITDFSILIKKLFNAIIPYLDTPFAFFGHSMGGYICFELAREIVKKSGQEPQCLYLSGVTPPNELRHDILLHKTCDEDFLNIIKSYQGITSAMTQNPEFLAFYLSLLRADITLIEKYEYIPGKPLNCPIVVFSGRDDKLVQAGSVMNWQKQTTGLFRSYLFNGGHFFLKDNRDEILKIIEESR
jgi:medium-chain acyl-[acyl-carrier-protein] hydrolase